MLDATAECAIISPHTCTVCPPGLLWSTESSSSCPSLKGKWVLSTKAGVQYRLSKLWDTTGHPSCGTLQVIQAVVHCRSSRLWYTAGRPGCGTLQVIQAVVHCRLSGCGTLQVIQAVVHCRLSGCGTLQVVQAVVHCRLSDCCSTFWLTEFLPARSDA